MDGQCSRADNTESGIGQRQGALGMHILAKYVADVCQDHFVIEHGSAVWNWPVNVGDHTPEAAPRFGHMRGWLSP